MTVSIKVGAELDAADLQRQLAELTRRINAAGQAIAQAGRVQFNPIPQATLDQARRIEQTMRNIAKIAPDLAGRMKATGQQGAAFDALDWSRLYGDPNQAIRARRNLFSLVTGLGFGALPTTAPAGARTPAGPASGAGSAVADLFEAALRSGGRFGDIAATGLHAGRAAAARAGGGIGGFGAGIMGGLGAGAGFAAIQGITALVSGVRQQISGAEQESIGFADLYRRLGGTGARNTFSGLRMRVRGASDAIGVGYDEALGLAGIAARRGNLSRAADVADMLTVGGGFGRAFGFDPGAGVAAFAGLRGAGVTRSTDEARRFGLAVAEGIARAGVFAKAEDYLAEVAAYGEQTARATLTRPNVEGFNAALAGLIGQGRPGLDVAGSAAILNRADQAIRRGGAAGEAGQAFIYQTIGRRLGLDPIQVEQLQEGGLFATAANTFGPDADGRPSLLGAFNRSAGLNPNSTDTTTVFEMLMDGINRQTSGGNHRLRLNYIAELFGLSQRQAAAVNALQPAQVGRLGALIGEDAFRRLSPAGLAQAGRVVAARDRGEIDAIAAELLDPNRRDALQPHERERLIAARERGSDDDYRKVLAELVATREAERTEGNKTRDTLLGIDKTLRDLATGLIGPMNTARDALLHMAGRTARGVAESVRNTELAEIAEQQRKEIDLAEEAQHSERASLHGETVAAQSALAAATRARDPAAIAAARARLEAAQARRRALDDALAAERQAIIERYEPARAAAEQRFQLMTAPRAAAGGAALGGQQRADIEAYLDETDRLLGMRPGTSRAQIAQESNWNPNAVSRAGAQGLAQVMPDTLRAIERRLGRSLDPFNPVDAAIIHREVMRENMARFGNQDDALRAYNGGWDPARWNNPETQGYVPSIERRRNAATPMPGQATPLPLPPGPQSSAQPGTGPQIAVVEGRFILTDPAGRPVAAPVSVRTRFGAPQPFGAIA